jgi:hypothetical protein
MLNKVKLQDGTLARQIVFKCLRKAIANSRDEEKKFTLNETTALIAKYTGAITLLCTRTYGVNGQI